MLCKRAWRLALIDWMFIEVDPQTLRRAVPNIQRTLVIRLSSYKRSWNADCLFERTLTLFKYDGTRHSARCLIQHSSQRRFRASASTSVRAIDSCGAFAAEMCIRRSNAVLSRRHMQSCRALQSVTEIYKLSGLPSRGPEDFSSSSLPQ